MIEVKAELTDISINYKNGKIRATFEYEGKPEEAEGLLQKAVRLIFKSWKEKRSLNANAYCWALINQIANVLKSSKEDVYLRMLKDYGQSEVVSIRSNINPEGYFKYFDEIGKGYVGNKEFTHYKLFKGSSEYDTQEMSILIDGVIQEAEALGISTLTPNEIEQLKQRWGDEAI